jgi:hypothetical protein
MRFSRVIVSPSGDSDVDLRGSKLSDRRQYCLEKENHGVTDPVRRLSAHPTWCRRRKPYRLPEKRIRDERTIQIASNVQSRGHHRSALDIALETGQHSRCVLLLKSGYSLELELQQLSSFPCTDQVSTALGRCHFVRVDRFTWKDGDTSRCSLQPILSETKNRPGWYYRSIFNDDSSEPHALFYSGPWENHALFEIRSLNDCTGRDHAVLNAGVTDLRLTRDQIATSCNSTRKPMMERRSLRPTRVGQLELSS